MSGINLELLALNKDKVYMNAILSSRITNLVHVLHVIRELEIAFTTKLRRR